jgi:hypothetical protein
MNRTKHGENIADDIQTHDAYGRFDVMNAADLWNILDQFQTHLIDHDEKNPLIYKISNWLNEIEKEFPEIEHQ